MYWQLLAVSSLQQHNGNILIDLSLPRNFYNLQ